MWDDEAFIERVRERARQINRKLPTKLKDALAKPAPVGRRIDTIVKIAAYLDWPLAEALGISQPPSQQMVNEDRLRRAIEAAEKIFRSRSRTNGDAASIAAETVEIYRLLSDREARGRLTTDEYLEGVIEARSASLARP